MRLAKPYSRMFLYFRLLVNHVAISVTISNCLESNVCLFSGHIILLSKMANTRISDSYPPHLDATRAPVAYGVRALPKMVACSTHWTLCLFTFILYLCAYLHLSYIFVLIYIYDLSYIFVLIYIYFIYHIFHKSTSNCGSILTFLQLKYNLS